MYLKSEKLTSYQPTVVISVIRWRQQRETGLGCICDLLWYFTGLSLLPKREETNATLFDSYYGESPLNPSPQKENCSCKFGVAVTTVSEKPNGFDHSAVGRFVWFARN